MHTDPLSVTGRLRQHGGWAWGKLRSWQVLWVVPSSDRPSVYINGKETYLAINVMTLSPLPGFGSPGPLLKESYKGGFCCPGGKGIGPVGTALTSSQSCSYPSPAATPQPQRGTWPCRLPTMEAAGGRCPPIPGARLHELSVICFIFSGCEAGQTQAYYTGSRTSPQIASLVSPAILSKSKIDFVTFWHIFYKTVQILSLKA